jgi:GntR family transcriptional regulator/MocR family aminotransferase
MDFPILLDRGSAVPLQRQLYLGIRQAILSGRLAPGRRIPSTRALAEALEISRTTTALAYELLVDEGYLEPSGGSGTYVCSSLPEIHLEAERTALDGSAAEAGLRLSRFGGQVAAMPGPPDPPGPSFYDFSQGCPALEDFPMALWMRLVARHARKGEKAVLGYGPDPQGHRPLREAIADYLRRSRAVKCGTDQVVVVSGTQQAIQLALRILVEPGGAVAMEDPGYLAARRAFQAHGASILPLPAGGRGLDLDPLDRPAGARCRLVYVTPSHQFPTGSVLDLPRRLRLLAWAQKRRAAVLEDDYDSEFRFRGRPLPAMQGLDTAGVVLYAGTFSKVLFPAVRLGYIVVPPSLARTFTLAQWIMCREPSSLLQRALADFIQEGHLERHIRRMRAIYAERRDALVASLGRHFGGRLEILGDESGMHLTARFETALGDEELTRRAAAAGVVLPSAAGLHLGASPGGRFIFGFAAMSPARIREGVRRLAAIGL